MVVKFFCLRLMVIENVVDSIEWISSPIARPWVVRTSQSSGESPQTSGGHRGARYRCSERDHVTGFGLLGHLHKMLISSGVSATVDAGAVPFIRGSVALARAGIAAGGTKRNRAFVDPHVGWGSLDEPERLLLADAQTSGGLLIATTDPDGLRQALERRGVLGTVIGTTSNREAAGRITIEGRIEPSTPG